MATPQRNRIAWLRRGAFASGLGAGLTLVALGRLPAAGGTLGLDVLVTTLPTGELAVAPVGRVGAGTALFPGRGQLRAHVTLQSQTDGPLTVRIRQRPSIGDADRALRVRVTSAGTTLYEGPAGGLRTASRGAVRIAPHGTGTLELRAWLPRGAPEGWRGRSVTLPLEYVSSIGGRVRR